MKDYKYLFENKINIDGDFSYPLQDDNKLFILKNENDIYLKIFKIMTSLLKAESHKDWLQRDVVSYAKNWLATNNKEHWSLPYEDFGNQSIEFSVQDIGLIKTDDTIEIKYILE